jgi:alkylation response protein AidB-like acyl-CoA dehydrogenase
MYATRCAQETATDAVQIFGGRGITKTGMGQYIEHVRLFASCYPAMITADALDSITARFPLMQFLAEVGVSSHVRQYSNCIIIAEDVLGDLGVRQAIRQMPKNTRL